VATVVHPLIVQLATAVPCYYHQRKKSKGITFKKCNVMIPGQMGHFATVYNQPSRGRIKIVAKDSLANDWCRSAGVLKRNRFGWNPGIEYYVAHGSTGNDYQLAVKALQIVQNVLPPC
jgi:hypothetical protein